MLALGSNTPPFSGGGITSPPFIVFASWGPSPRGWHELFPFFVLFEQKERSKSFGFRLLFFRRKVGLSTLLITKRNGGRYCSHRHSRVKNRQMNTPQYSNSRVGMNKPSKSKK